MGVGVLISYAVYQSASSVASLPISFGWQLMNKGKVRRQQPRQLPGVAP